jgi:wobble nucleotide-excising tRNase
LLKKITIANKNAQTELVVDEFRSVLDEEYYALSEKHLSDFAVSLPLKGDEAEITMTPSISGNPIYKILSEGEQRLHALALFFSELKFQNHYIIVLDDPVSSFDYNYIENVAMRIRDFINNNTHKQFIIFTHNWEFFVGLQTTLNKAKLGNKFSVMILESCSIVSEYTEDINDLKKKIEECLNETSEPLREKKEIMAGNMRLLIETIVNKYVFDGQRHQYKQKKQSVSNFSVYTKITPLNNSEATKLTDLYALLSMSEHDDPRRAYVNQDKAVFKNRYDDILKIEEQIISRK